MAFKIPQIEHDSKVVGPLTFRQFVFVGTAIAAVFFFWFVLPFIPFLIASLLALFAAGAFAFYKVEGVALTDLILQFFSFTAGPKTYIWKRKGGRGGRIQARQEYSTPQKGAPQKREVELEQSLENNISRTARSTQIRK